MYFKTDFYLWRDFRYRNITSFKQVSKRAKILGQSICVRHYAEQNKISYLPFFLLQSKKKKVRSIQREALPPYSVVIRSRILASKKTPLSCLSYCCGVNTNKTESRTVNQYFFGITLPKVFALRALRQKGSFESKASQKVFFSGGLKAGLYQNEKYRTQGLQKEKAKTTLSGEVFKERFTDILQTSLEQVGFSLKSNNKKSYKACPITFWKKLQKNTNRRLPYFPPLSFSFLLSFPATKVLQSFEKKHRKRLCSTKLVPYQEYGRRRDTKLYKIALTIKIGDYLSSGDKIGEEALCKKKVLQKNKSLFAHRPKLSKEDEMFANKVMFYSQINLITSTNTSTNRRFVRSFLSNATEKAKLCNISVANKYKSSYKSKICTCKKICTSFVRNHFLCVTNQRFVCSASNLTFSNNFCPSKSHFLLRSSASHFLSPEVNRAKATEVIPSESHFISPEVSRAKATKVIRADATEVNRAEATEVSRALHEAKQTKFRFITATEVKSPAKTKKSFVRTTITPSCRTNSGFKVKTFSQKRTKCQNVSTPIILGLSGRIVTISKTQIIVQKTQPVLFYKSANLHIKKGSWVKQGSPILTLTHQTLITGDIVQGIPRIEQLFEAFTSPPPAFKDKGDFTKFKEGYNTLHSQVRDIFRNNWLKNRLPIAVRKSLEEIGYILVEMIQKVYLSQGVLIADKHIEIIVRQIASKGQILDSGTTGLFLEEILPIRQIENANLTTPGKKCLYVPAVMGLTAAALNSDSFISAASFQETTRVLSRDAIVGKSDFLRGLKEKVVIGDLISAGTGLDLYFIYTTMLTN